MLSGIKTVITLALLIEFLQLFVGGKEYGRFLRLITGLLVACGICAWLFQLAGRLDDETWASWFAAGENSLWQWQDQAAEKLEVLEREISEQEGSGGENSEEAERIPEIRIEEIPQIYIEEIRVEGKTAAD